ncbi:YjgP/YjgQ family permease [Treponema denticola]|uniref:LptF/LptG family permease n=1 Tax=Treponema denticola TaxID=158 RepID=UPI0020A552AD|nr:LptF/LptG family permease [Treponema denticola]UTC95670.1 YjgP/YjgQ family permease [Treponema denticola]
MRGLSFNHKTIFVYVFKELLLYFIGSFLFLFFIFFVNQILLMAEEILSKKAPTKDVLLLLFYSLPFIIAITAPYAALIGTLMCLGRFSADHEFISMNALGISTSFILIPVFALGVFVSVGSFITNDILIPRGTIKFNEVLYNIASSTPALELESYSVKRNENSIVVSGLIKDNSIHDLLIIDSSQRGAKRFLSSSQTDVKKSNDRSIIMQLEMLNPRLLNLDLNNRSKFDVVYGESITYNVLAKDVAPKFISSSGPDKMTSYDLIKDIKQKKEAGDTSPRLLNIYIMELHRKFSVPFGAFFFVLLAFAISRAGKTYDQSTGFIVGLLISVAYWAFLIGGQMLCLESGLNINGALVMWFPNVLLVICTAVIAIKRFLK